MAPSFARSISFPLSPSRSSKPAARMAASYHARSVSLPLPCRSHSILAHLHTHIRAVRACAQQDHHPGGITASASSGLAHVDALHAALADLPEAQAALSAGAGAGASGHDRLLDTFLRLADAHGTFQEALLDLKRDVAEALAAIRRRDGARLASALRSQRRAGKELARLAAVAAKDGAATPRPSRLGGSGSSSAAEVEVAGLLAEAAAATASASAALFSTVAAMSASASAAACSCKRTAALMCLLLNKKVPAEEAENKETTAALVERLEELVECIDHLESGTEKVFRSLVQTRVALLNVHTNIF